MRNLSLIKRYVSSATKAIAEESTAERSFSRMTGFQVHNYGDLDEIQFSKQLKKPIIKSPDELLIKVDASSVNPLDIAMISGYGSTLLNTMRCNSHKIEFPLTLGRDFVGTVVRKGMEVDSTKIKLGDKVFGIAPFHKDGCHAEYVKVDKCHVSKKPENMTDIDAAALLYAGLTAYSGIFLSAQLNGLSGLFLLSDSIQGNGKGKKVLVLGGSGGVGHLAIQILQAEGAEVIATCGTDAISFVENLGVSKCIDYTATDSDEILLNESPYDIILDCAGKGPEYASSLPWSFNSFVTFKSPMLKNFDEKGLIVGGLNNIKDILSQNIVTNKRGIVKWAYFLPTKIGIEYLKKLVVQKKLSPIIDSIFSYCDLPKAYEKVNNGHLRGKVVIDFNLK